MWNLLWISVVLSEVITAIMNTIMGYLWWGRISTDLILIGTVDAFFVALTVTAVIILIFREFTKVEGESKARVEKSLREKEESERRYRAIVEDQTELVCRFSPEGSLTFVNSSFSFYFSRSKEELLGGPFPVAGGSLFPEIRQKLGGLSPFSPLTTFEHRMESPGGDERWQHWTCRAIFDQKNRLAEYQAVGRDITERKEAEGYRRRIDIHREREEICRWLHDDIGSDLYNIILIAEMIQQRKVGGGETYNSLEWIADASRNALNSVRGYVNFAEQVGPSINDLVAYIKDFGDVFFKGTNVEFRFTGKIEDSDLPILPMKSFSVYLIYKEAITNILKDSRVKRVNVLLEEASDSLALTIQDDGTGAGRPLLQRDGCGTRNLYHRAEAMGGEFVYFSDPEGGTLVRLTVPV
jgi:PAS domain S-box-containing protein